MKELFIIFLVLATINIIGGLILGLKVVQLAFLVVAVMFVIAIIIAIVYGIQRLVKEDDE